MQTSLECLVCFMQQALITGRLSSGDTSVQRKVVNEVGRLVSDLDMSLSPPENAVLVYRLIAAITNENDPFAAAKKKSTELVLGIRDEVRRRIETADNQLYTAVQFAIASNIIDYGVQHEFDALETLSRCREQEFCIDEFDLFEQEINQYAGPRILYLADNSGEIIFDGLLIEQLLKLGCTVNMVVREGVTLNDVTMKEAEESGISKLCRVMTSGVVCPGTPLYSCSEEIREAFRTSDIIISKGQGNFETLSDVDAPLYFFLTVKCEVVARSIATMKNVSQDRLKGKGEMILMRKERVRVHQPPIFVRSG